MESSPDPIDTRLVLTVSRLSALLSSQQKNSVNGGNNLTKNFEELRYKNRNNGNWQARLHERKLRVTAKTMKTDGAWKRTHKPYGWLMRGVRMLTNHVEKNHTLTTLIWYISRS